MRKINIEVDKKTTAFYTDGACSQKSELKNGGWSFVQLIPCVTTRMQSGYETYVESGAKENTTNNEMELTAVYMALVKAMKERYTTVTVYSDSAYVVNAINNNWLLNWYKNGWKTKDNKDVKNREIWEKMYKLIYLKKMNIRMIHVAGHKGNILNELADKHAVEAKESIK